MPVDHREIAFEAAIEHHLLNAAGFAKADPAQFDRERAIDPALIIPFVRQTQAEAWECLEKPDALAARVEAAIARLREYRSASIIAAVAGKIDVRNLGSDRESR